MNFLKNSLTQKDKYKNILTDNNKKNNLQEINSYSWFLEPFLHLSKAVLICKDVQKGAVINTELKFDFDSFLNSSQMKNNSKTDKFNFSTVTKNYQFLYFNFVKDKNLVFSLKKVCELLLIEVINTCKLTLSERDELTRDYADFFEVISKSAFDSANYIKKLSKYMTSAQLTKSLRKFATKGAFTITPVGHYGDIIDFIKANDVSKKR